jgi:hypothetical protein
MHIVVQEILSIHAFFTHFVGIITAVADNFAAACVDRPVISVKRLWQTADWALPVTAAIGLPK